MTLQPDDQEPFIPSKPPDDLSIDDHDAYVAAVATIRDILRRNPYKDFSKEIRRLSRAELKARRRLEWHEKNERERNARLAAAIERRAQNATRHAEYRSERFLMRQLVDDPRLEPPSDPLHPDVAAVLDHPDLVDR